VSVISRHVSITLMVHTRCTSGKSLPTSCRTYMACARHAVSYQCSPGRSLVRPQPRHSRHPSWPCRTTVKKLRQGA
jgi:hypothetical protein